MADIIELLLEEKSRGTACEILFTQWMLAKSYVPKVQSAIIRTFPHYSLHDASHSKTLLDCIVRVLGVDAVGGLGPVDLWLLLAAAYYHDLGMVPSGEEIECTLRDGEFRQFVNDCQKDESNPLYPFASVFEIKDDGVYYKDVALSGNNYDGAHFLLAEFVRRKHAQKAEESLKNDDSIHLAGSPIPERLLDILGMVCKNHTEGFDDVMKLPKSEVGLGMDDCHPRFIACMLRIGDLLDLDNNRFSDVLLKTLPVIPRDSLLHKKKHLSVKHLRIDAERIEVTSKTDSYEVADMMNRWLEMISDEFRRQRDIWQEIVPAGFPSYLPTVGELKVDLIGYDTIDGKKRPGFEIDTSKAIEMLQGSGLYSSPAQCMRELLQNAVDATYLSIFLERRRRNAKGLETVEDFMRLCLQKEIKVSIKNTGIEGSNVIWHVCIEDNGLGMSKADLGYLARTGSKNQDKVKLIEQMPDFMRPSGTFGIGFQSVFLITDKVIIRTRKMNSAEEMTAELYNPSGPRKGAVLVKTAPATMDYGTCLEFDYKAEKDLTHWSVSGGQLYSMYTIHSFDFVADKTLNLETAKILDETASYCHMSPIPISVTVNGDVLTFKRETAIPFDYYSPSEGLQLSVLSEDDRTVYFFRNQVVRNPGINLSFVKVSVNLLKGDARELLTLNRNEFQYQAHETVKNRIQSALAEVCKLRPELIPESSRPLVSMFLHRYAGNRIDEFPIIKDEWKHYRPSYDIIETQRAHVWEHTFGVIVTLAEGKPVVWLSVDSDRNTGVEIKGDFVIIRASKSNPDVMLFLMGQIVHSHPYPSNCVKEYCPNEEGTLFSVAPVDPIVDWHNWFMQYLGRAYYGRSLMPCNADYQFLRLRDDASFLLAFDSTFGVSIHPKMICPYVRELESNSWRPKYKRLKWDDADGELYRITYENRADSSVTLQKIQEAFQIMKDSLEPIVDEINKNND